MTTRVVVDPSGTSTHRVSPTTSSYAYTSGTCYPAGAAGALGGEAAAALLAGRVTGASQSMR